VGRFGGWAWLICWFVQLLRSGSPVAPLIGGPYFRYLLMRSAKSYAL
jgi:hypothetical protein